MLVVAVVIQYAPHAKTDFREIGSNPFLITQRPLRTKGYVYYIKFGNWGLTPKDTELSKFLWLNYQNYCII